MKAEVRQLRRRFLFRYCSVGLIGLVLGLAFYAGDLLDRLGLPPEHNQSVRKRLAGFAK